MALHVRLFKELPGFTLDVDWRLGPEIGVLFGYSGSGKSMTIRTIAGLEEADCGYIRFGQRVLYDTRTRTNIPAQKRDIGYMSQNGCLFPHMTVKGNIEYGLKNLSRTERTGRLSEMLCTFSLEGLEDRYPGQISGGQRQRVALARAMARRPRMLLLDEPFSGLDLPLRIDLWQLLQDLLEEYRVPVLVVTHDPFEARSMANRLIVYREGGVMATGTPAEVLGGGGDSPEHRTLRTGFGKPKFGAA